MLILDGKSLSLALRAKLKQKTLAFQEKYKKAPGLAVLIVGDNEASHIYVNRKIKACQQVGFQSYRFKYSQNAFLEDLKEKIQALNKDPLVHGILVQLPLPVHLNKDKMLSLIKPEKDPDGLTLENQGLFWSGRPRVVPCTAFGIIRLLKHYNIPIARKKGRSGRPKPDCGSPRCRLSFAKSGHCNSMSFPNSKSKSLYSFSGYCRSLRRKKGAAFKKGL